MNKFSFVNLCVRAWALPALSLIFSGVPARVSPLAKKAGAGRPAMSASVRHLEQLGLLQRNKGHGHPLRPEFELTDNGKVVAEWAARLDGLLASEDARAVTRYAWCLPIMAQLASYPRFSDLRVALHPITDRALSQALKRLEEIGWVSRTVDARSHPPKVSYSVALAGRSIAKHAATLDGALHAAEMPESRDSDGQKALP